DLTQALASTLLLQRCLDSGRLDIDDRVRRWTPQYPEANTTVDQLLRHTTPSGTFQYDTNRFAWVGSIVEQCANERYFRVISGELLDRLGMADSMPSHDLSAFQSVITDSVHARYQRVLERI